MGATASRLAIPGGMQSEPSLPKKKILIVDDEALVLKFLERTLQLGGYEVFTAPNGSEALRYFAQGTCDLVITDRAMPGLCGEELAIALRKIAPNIPVVLFTGTGGLTRDPTLFAAVVAKPVAARALFALVAQVLRTGTNA